jgi:hypothetical protein
MARRSCRTSGPPEITCGASGSAHRVAVEQIATDDLDASGEQQSRPRLRSEA